MPGKYRWREMERQNARRVNPPQQLAQYEASRAPVEPDDEDELTDAEVIELIRNPHDFGGWFCEEECGGWAHPDDTHANPDDYSDDELLAMNEAMTEACLTLCVMHVDHRYPVVPSGIWEPQVEEALARLEALDRDPGDPAYHVSHDELREVFDDLPHARWYIEHQHEVGELRLRVID